MKKLIVITITLLHSLSMISAEVVTFRFTDGIENKTVKTKMEQTVSKILTEANAAYDSKRKMNYSKMGISSSVQKSITSLWNHSPFYCIDTDIVEHCITTSTGYQVRNIPLILKPFDSPDDEEGDYQEAVISFDKQGNLVSFYLSIGMNLYMNVVKANQSVTDLRLRQIILDYVEQFRTAYNQKDLDFLEAIFSDDALIITGKVIQRKTNDGIRLPEQIEYLKRTKREYLDRLRTVFKNNRQIRVIFDDIDVSLHPTYKNVYLVTLHQGYSSDRYHDDGYLYILWDFRKEKPQIYVRTWQPDMYNADGPGSKFVPTEADIRNMLLKWDGLLIQE